ncbi:MAG: hypothetical protein WKH64_08340 [Chloroflexia bacterium]
MAATDFVTRALPEALGFVERRSGVRILGPITVVIASIREGDPCAVRGLASSDADQIYLYVGGGVSRAQLQVGLVHELGHFAQYQVAGGAVASSTLAEGFATYAAGRYWPGWDGDTGFQGAVKRYRASGSYIPLTQGRLACDTETRDRIYTERAAFVEWLLRTQGEDKFWRLNKLSVRSTEPPSYSEEYPYLKPPVLLNNPVYESAPWERVYDASLPELERRWLASL